MFPAVTLPTLDGKRVTRADLAGRVVLVEFWATWNKRNYDAVKAITDPAALDRTLCEIPGVVGTGLFIAMAADPLSRLSGLSATSEWIAGAALVGMALDRDRVLRILIEPACLVAQDARRLAARRERHPAARERLLRRWRLRLGPAGPGRAAFASPLPWEPHSLASPTS